MNAAILSRTLLAGLALALTASAPAYAATYQIGLLQAGAGTGSGSFEFTNSGSSGTATASLATNASSAIGVQSFVSAPVNVEVVAVDFTDNKTPPNQITGNFVEGLTGTLQTAETTGLANGQCLMNACFYRITFAFTASTTNPDAAQKTYQIDLVRVSTNSVVATPVPTGTYSVANTATIPEPGALALVALALAALGFAQFRRRRHDTRHIAA